MRRTITESSLSLTLRLVTDTEQESEPVYSLFGIVNRGLITLQGTLGAQHTELLNYCLRSLEILQSKYYTDYNTSSTDTEGAPVVHLPFTLDTAGTS